MSSTSNGFCFPMLCWFVCLSTPITILGLTRVYGPTTELRNDDEPVPWPARAIDVLFFGDLFFTVVLIWLMRKCRGVTAAIAIPLLCLTAFIAFWGGLWLSGNWL